MASTNVKSDRRISYLRALNETLDQEMGRDPPWSSWEKT